MKRRLWIGLFITAIAIFTAGCESDQPTTAKPAQQKQFSLYAADVEQTLAGDKTLYSWGYGLWDEEKQKPITAPTVPGPELRVTEGDHVKIIFHNQQLEPHTIHFHGIDNSFEGDGTPGISQEEVKDGETYTYEFTATKSGTYFYHCHVEPDRHPEMGLYGAFIVEPKKKVQYDGETVLMIAERDPLLSLAEGNEEGKFVGTAAEHETLHGEYDTLNRHPKYFTFNGKTDPDIPPIKVKKGGKYLIRVINAGSDVHSIHTHGHHFQVIASDGRALKDPITKDTIEIAPGERYDLVLTADNPGVWPIHCHMGPHGTHGMHMLLVYKGYEEQSAEHHHEQAADHKQNAEQMLSLLDNLKKQIEAKDTDQVKKTAKSLWDAWTDFEDGVKETNPELYAKIEQYLAPIVAGSKRDDLADNLDTLNKMIPSLREQLEQLNK